MAEPLTAGAGDNAAEVKLACDTSQWEKSLDAAAKALAAAAAKMESAFARTGQAVAASSNQMAASTAAAANQMDAKFDRVLAGLEMERASIGQTTAAVRLLQYQEQGYTQTQLAEIGKRLHANEALRKSEERMRQAKQGALSQAQVALGGELGQFAGAAVAGGLAGAVVVGGAAAVKWLHNIATDADHAADRLKEAERRASEFAKAVDRAVARSAEWDAAFAHSPAAMFGHLTRELQDAEKGFNDLSETVAATRARLKEVDESSALAGRSDELVAQIKADLEGKAAALEKARERLEAVAKRRTRLENPLKDPAFLGDMGRLTAELRKQEETWGMSAEQVQLYELRVKDFGGKAKKELDKIGEAIDKHAAVMKGKELQKNFDDTVKAIEREGRAIGKTADEVRLLELAEQGFTAAQLAAVKKRLDANAALREAEEQLKKAQETPEAKGAVAAALGASQAAASVAVAIRAADARPQAAAAQATGFARLVDLGTKQLTEAQVAAAAARESRDLLRRLVEGAGDAGDFGTGGDF